VLPARALNGMSRAKRILLFVMAAFYCFAGFNHLLNPAFYVAIIPPGLPSPEWLNVASGLAEIVLGVYVLEPRTRVLAAWGIIALLIAVFPANVYVALHNVGLPDGAQGTGNALLNWVRLPFQVLFAVWAWWYTRETGALEPAAARPV
jgi:uncharacterized membrane protein